MLICPTVAGNLRLLIENIQKVCLPCLVARSGASLTMLNRNVCSKALTSAQYGVLICIRCHDFRKQDVQVGLILYTVVPCCLMVAYLIELFAAYEARTSLLRAFNSDKKDGKRDGSSSPTLEEQARFRTTWYLIMGLHFMNISAALVVTSLVVYYYVNHPLIGTIVEMHAIIVWLKTASYALTNRDFRHAYLHPQTGECEAIPEMYDSCKYPKNITLGNLCYFWWAPTLVYQPVYPRNDKIRWLFVLKRSAEVLGLCVAMWILSAQYAAPTLQNSLTAFENKDVTGMLERLLKLSTISLVIWLAGFFALFQSFLNALAEVMRFGDRSFYDDCESAASQVEALYAQFSQFTDRHSKGWNSDSFGTYWRTWNKPVSSYFRRHVFQPLMGRGWSYDFSAVVVFTISAFLHELAVGIPTHRIIGQCLASAHFLPPRVR